jgi:glycine hydroxymethyltransferase
VDFRGSEMTGKRAQELLERIGITANKNSVPYDERPPTITSGLRLGTPAMTTRGFGTDEMREVGKTIVEVLTGNLDDTALDRLKERNHELAASFPLYSTLSSTTAAV